MRSMTSAMVAGPVIVSDITGYLSIEVIGRAIRRDVVSGLELTLGRRDRLVTDAADEPALDPRAWVVRPVPPPLSRAEQAAAVIEELAFTAGPSQRIGSKDDLRAVVSVSVGTLNEALALAQARGVVTMRRGPGGGIFAAPRPSLVRLGNFMIGLGSDETTAADALRIRNALDSLIIEDALAHSSAADVAALRAVVTHLRERLAAGDVPALVHGTWAYQRRVAEISPNPLLRSMYVSLLGVLDEGTVAIGAPREGDDLAHVFGLFERMTDALESRDRDAALGVMREFLASQD